MWRVFRSDALKLMIDNQPMSDEDTNVSQGNPGRIPQRDIDPDASNTNADEELLIGTFTSA